MDARIDMPAPIAVGPAVKGALAHRGQIIGDELGAEFVAFVDDRPEHVRGRFEGESGRVADARHIGAVSPGRGVDLPDHRAIFLDAHAALADIAVRPDAHIELRAVGARRERFGPMMIYRRGQLGDFLAWRADARLAVARS